MCFFNRTTHIHIWLLRHNMLFMVYNDCPGQQEPQVSRQLNTYGTLWSGNLVFLKSLPQPSQNWDNRCSSLGQSITGWHSAPLWPFACKNSCLLCRQRGLNCVLMWLFKHPLPWNVCFLWSESTPVVPWLSYRPLNPRFAGSNPAAVDGFFQSVKILSMTSFGREVKLLVPCHRFRARKRNSTRIVKLFKLTVESNTNDLSC